VPLGYTLKPNLLFDLFLHYMHAWIPTEVVHLLFLVVEFNAKDPSPQRHTVLSGLHYWRWFCSSSDLRLGFWSLHVKHTHWAMHLLTGITVHDEQSPLLAYPLCEYGFSDMIETHELRETFEQTAEHLRPIFLQNWSLYIFMNQFLSSFCKLCISCDWIDASPWSYSLRHPTLIQPMIHTSAPLLKIPIGLILIKRSSPNFFLVYYRSLDVVSLSMNCYDPLWVTVALLERSGHCAAGAGET